MQTAAKKLGFLKGMVRTNKPYTGYVGGSVNNATLPKGGRKQVSVMDGKLVFWIVRDFDVTVLPEDVVGCNLIGAGLYTGRSATAKYGNSTKRAQEYGVALDMQFADGTSGKLEIIDFLAFESAAVYPTNAKWSACLDSDNYIPVVSGWLAPNGVKNEHYDDLVCPEGYTPDITALYLKAESSNKIMVAFETASAIKMQTRLGDVYNAVNLGRFGDFADDKVVAIGKDGVKKVMGVKAQYISVNGKSRKYIRKK